MLIFILVLSFSSAVFELKKVEVKFFSDENREVPLSQNKIFSTASSVQALIDTANFEFGKLIFLHKKEKYILNLERGNPYIEALSIEAVFPNKFVLKARERSGVFYIQNDGKFLILDKDYKILDIKNNMESDNLIEISFRQNSSFVSFFAFFSLFAFALSPAQFLSENNRVFQSLDLWKYAVAYDLANDLSKMVIINENGTVFADIHTKSASYGIKLVVVNLLENFEKKIKKLLDALFTLRQNEKIKTTYGELKIDENFNCFWNNL